MGRSPANGRTPMSAAARKREQLARQWTRIFEADESQWTERDCLLILGSSRFENGSPMDRAAWEQLGRLRGFEAKSKPAPKKARQIKLPRKSKPSRDLDGRFEVSMKYAKMAALTLENIQDSHPDREEAFDYVLEWIRLNR